MGAPERGQQSPSLPSVTDATAFALLRSRLRDARESLQCTQHRLATRLGVTQSFVSKYERGHRRLDVIDFLFLCRALGVPPSEVLDPVSHLISGTVEESGRKPSVYPCHGTGDR